MSRDDEYDRKRDEKFGARRGVGSSAGSRPMTNMSPAQMAVDTYQRRGATARMSPAQMAVEAMKRMSAEERARRAEELERERQKMMASRRMYRPAPMASSEESRGILSGAMRRK